MRHSLSDLIEAHRFYSEKLEAVENETLSGYNLRTCGCLGQREFDSLKAKKINELQSRIDGLEYFIDADVKGMQRDKENEKPRPVIAGDIKYSSYDDYLKSRKEDKW